MRDVERALLDASIAEQHRALDLLDLREAVAARAPDVRRRGLAVARDLTYTLRN